MKTALALVLVLVAAASAAKTHQKRSSTYSANLNDYVDTVVENLQAFISASSLEPLAIPNVTESFSVKEWLITFSGRLSLYDGELSGLSTVKRYGDVNLGYDGETLSFDADMGVDTTTAAYAYEAKLFGIEETGTATITVEEIEETVTFGVNVKNYTIATPTFEITSVGSATAEMSGNQLTDWLFDAVMDIVLATTKTNIADQINTDVNALLSSVADAANAYILSILISV